MNECHSFLTACPLASLPLPEQQQLQLFRSIVTSTRE